MKKILTAVLALSLVFVLVACSGGSLVGKWMFGVNYYEFTEDGKVTVSLNGMDYKGTYTAEDGKINMTVSGLVGEKTVELTYEIDGDTLKLDGDTTLTGVPTALEFTKQ